ncbi:uncharacterized protein C8Q71DRAFT_132387 [Rhodofomes roseus]|uniref:Uncharacterized protein n=1 Tax=Rhodofomes roseus TaxID=34475 RepID=A0ABQ8KBW7_9APHY|nr:uncharacterized protein C8Q71DRAFT_132387 [Rhodofomes roseus]KAH9834928.1 hypothetical protein C8Q71DRAFT_132387 [Rhodofomes roseus]
MPRPAPLVDVAVGCTLPTCCSTSTWPAPFRSLPACARSPRPLPSRPSPSSSVLFTSPTSVPACATRSYSSTPTSPASSWLASDASAPLVLCPHPFSVDGGRSRLSPPMRSHTAKAYWRVPHLQHVSDTAAANAQCTPFPQSIPSGRGWVQQCEEEESRRTPTRGCTRVL